MSGPVWLSMSQDRSDARAILTSSTISVAAAAFIFKAVWHATNNLYDLFVGTTTGPGVVTKSAESILDQLETEWRRFERACGSPIEPQMATRNCAGEPEAAAR